MAEGGMKPGASVDSVARSARPVLSHVEIVANERSGGVGPGAAAEAEALVRAFGLQARARVLDPEALGEGLKAALDARPDLLVVLGGDGTAGAAADLAGPYGPLLAPLPGGTMNMLPHALYGRSRPSSRIISSAPRQSRRP